MTTTMLAAESPRSRSRVTALSGHGPVTAVVAPQEIVQPGANTAPSAHVALCTALSAYFEANDIANVAKRTADKAKKTLESLMVETGTVLVRTTATVTNGAIKPVIADIAERLEDYIDIETLRRLVDEPTFLRIVSASKKAVTDIAGTNIAVQATKSHMKPPSLSVREDK